MFDSKTKGNIIDVIYDKSEKYDELDGFSSLGDSVRLFFWNLKNNPYNIENIQVSFKYSDIILKIPDRLGIEKWADETKLMAIKALKEVYPHVEAIITYGEYVKWPKNTFSASGSTTLSEKNALRHIMNDYKKESEKDSTRGSCVKLHGSSDEKQEEILTIYKPLKPINKRGFITVEISKSFSSNEVIKKRIATALNLSCQMLG